MRQNSIGNYLKPLKAIFNRAIKTKVVDREDYPFNDIFIKTEKTKKKELFSKKI
ncbi:phage integrase SAM-like domain-containing protein [Pedobacter sp.]|uniref:phage integrase SAM-like domain-containing protein n=1 Tax=Pedobacter sp. TaxID=1411316 RepID=UPI0035697823